MYLWITSRCNMTCAHCIHNCTEEGEDMSMETFSNAVQAAEDIGAYLTLGGGEPTLHPNFLEMLMKSIVADTEEVFLVTNGSNTEISRYLFKLAKKGVIGCVLSQDDYHDPIDMEIVEMFTKANFIRNVTGKELNGGRCNFGEETSCICEGLEVRPNGDIRVCGCEDSPVIGNVNCIGSLADLLKESGYESFSCYKEKEENNED